MSTIHSAGAAAAAVARARSRRGDHDPAAPQDSRHDSKYGLSFAPHRQTRRKRGLVVAVVLVATVLALALGLDLL